MFKPKWIQFKWDLSTLPDDITPPEIKGDLRLAEKEDREACLNVIRHALMSERAWGGDIDRFEEDLDELFPKAFSADHEAEIVVWEDGRRIVGLSSLYPNADSPRQLVSGVCIFEEYRCRGGGKALLLRSLQRLKARGLSTASVITRQNITAAKFLYPKWNPSQQILEELPTWNLAVAK
ncbi:MAG: GNAT family N-acetyltransferase [Candidatus Methylacidiphilales bacterium]